MGDTRDATNQQSQEWVIYVVAVIAEMVTAAGFIPQYTSILRSSVLFCLYREWGLAVGCGLLLPRFVGALLGVCFLKQKWLALKVRHGRTAPCLFTVIVFLSLRVYSLSSPVAF